MHTLVRGIHRFREQVFREQEELFKRLAAGQAPEALFITCSDSRVDPTLITQSKPGDLFVIRNAGNLVPTPRKRGYSGEEAAVEYAIKVLGIKNIIVCGHSNCGAIGGLLRMDKLKDLPAVKSWLRFAKQTLDIVKKRYSGLPEGEKLNVAIQENVLVQLENLRRLPSVAKAIKDSSVKLFGLVYKIESGEVYAYDPKQQQFVLPKKNQALPEAPLSPPSPLNVPPPLKPVSSGMPQTKAG